VDQDGQNFGVVKTVMETTAQGAADDIPQVHSIKIVTDDGMRAEVVFLKRWFSRELPHRHAVNNSPLSYICYDTILI